jgi:hypothetical protein
MLTVAALAASLAARADQSCDPNDTGCLIFSGQRAIPAHLRDDDRALPAWTTRCVNCHTATGSPSTAFAPPLTHDSLLLAASRRGGPPTAYDQASFCSVLRGGIDPAHVLLRKSMPLFQASDEDCAALWRFVAGR